MNMKNEDRPSAATDFSWLGWKRVDLARHLASLHTLKLVLFHFFGILVTL